MNPNHETTANRYRKAAQGWFIDASRYLGSRRNWRLERGRNLQTVADFWKGYA